MQSRKSLHFCIVSSVGLACLDANTLSAGNNRPLIARAMKRNTPVTSCMNLVPAMSNFGDSIGCVSYCALAP